MILLLVALSGFCAAFAWTYAIMAVEERKAKLASAWDGAIMLFGTVIPLQLWGDQRQLAVLIALTIGNMIGTYVAVTVHKR